MTEETIKRLVGRYSREVRAAKRVLEDMKNIKGCKNRDTVRWLRRLARRKLKTSQHMLDSFKSGLLH